MAEKRFIIEVRTKGFSRATKDFKTLNKDGERFVDTTRRMRRSTQGLEAGLGSLRNRLLVNSFAIAAITKSFQLFFRTAVQFEDVKTRLVGLTGSVEGAEFAFDKLNQVASRTPFALGDVVNAGAQLEAFGASATKTIGPITDLAAFMGTTATEAANAFGRAYAGGAGSADILRERGVLNIIKSFKGIEDLSKITLPEFRLALESALVDPTVGIEGSADRMSKTFSGAMSNMTDSLSRLTAAISSRFLPLITDMVKGITDVSDAGVDLFTGDQRTISDVFGLADSKRQISSFTTKDIPLLKQQIDDLQKEVDKQLQKREKQPLIDGIVGGLGDVNITGIVAPIQAAQDETRTFTILTEQNAVALDNSGTKILNMAEGITSIINPFQNVKNALDEQNQVLATFGDTLDVDQARLQLLKDRLIELETEEAKRTESIREQTQAEIIRQAAIAGRVASQEREKELATGFIQLFNQTEEGQKRNIENTIKLIEANREFLSQFGDVDAVIANLNNSLVNSESSSNSAARGMNVLGNAVSSLRGGVSDTNQLFSIFLRTASSLASIADPTGASGGLLGLFSSFFAHTGGLITNRGIQRFANGGVVQGQDNVPIMAQAGEFVMRREAVQNIGVQNLAQMNRTGDAGGVTVNISAPLVDETVIDHIIPAINKATNRNLA